MYEFTLRVFYGDKIVASEHFAVKEPRLASQLAVHVSTYLARESVPLWMFDPKRVSWAIVEEHPVECVR